MDYGRGMTKTQTTYTFQEGTWAGAEVWAWDGVNGTMIGRASFDSTIGDNETVTVTLDNGRSRTNFETPTDALAWVKENA